METECDLKPWQCEFCTYMNKPTWLVCGMCFKECKAPNDNGVQLDFLDTDVDNLCGLNAAPDYPVQPVVAMVSAAATTNASSVYIPPIPAVSLVSTSTSACFTNPITSIAASGYFNAGSTSYVGATAYTGGIPAPFSPVSTQNIASSTANNAATKKYSPYTVLPAYTNATSGTGWSRNNGRLVRVTAPAITTTAKTDIIPAHPNVPRLRVITPFFFNSSSATKVTSSAPFVPSTTTFNSPLYSGGARMPLPRRTETPFTFPTYNGGNVVTPVTPLVTTPATNFNFNSYNAGAQIAQPNPLVALPKLPNFPVAPPNLPNFSVASPNLPNNLGASPNIVSDYSNTGINSTQNGARSTASTVSNLPNVFQCRPVTQITPISRTENFNPFLTSPNNTVAGTSSVTPIPNPNPPPVTSAPTFNGAARVTTAAFAAAFTTDAASGWMCSYCTFINDNLLRRCAVCDTEKIEKLVKEQPVQVLPPPPPPLAADNNSDVANDIHFECPSCFLLYAQSEGMMLENCGHKFCKNCLSEVVCYSEDMQLKCPYKIRGVFCNNLITGQEIISILKFSADDANAATAQPAQQNVVVGPSQQNIPGPSKSNVAAGDSINLCSDEEEAENRIRNLPIIAERNPAQVIGNELNYQELLDLEKEVLIPNMENFDCTICMTEQSPGEGVVIRDCLHMFCRECLKQAIKCNTDAEMRCPFGDGTTRCDSMLQDREIKALVDANDFEKHLSRSIKEAEGKIQNTFHCKTVDCVGWCEYEEEVTAFNCPVCTKTNCINCKAIHTGLNCKQYQINVQLNSANNPEDAKTNKMLQNMLQKGTAMHCPKCAIILSKVTGCDWLCCSMCKTEICWVTRGPRWGPKGRGDTSGGCRCRFKNGKACHPKCGNCH